MICAVVACELTLPFILSIYCHIDRPFFLLLLQLHYDKVVFSSFFFPSAILSLLYTPPVPPSPSSPLSPFH